MEECHFRSKRKFLKKTNIRLVATNNIIFPLWHVFSGRAPSKGSNNRDVSRATSTWTMEMGMAILQAIKQTQDH